MAKQKNEIDFSPTNPENIAAGAETEETEEGSSLEVSVGPEEEEKPEVVTLSPEEFAALKASGDSAKAVQAGLEGLASKLQPQVIQAPTANSPRQTSEEFFAEHSDDIFDKEKGAKTLKQYNRMVADEEYGPMLRGMSTTLANTRKELLEAKDPHFKKYKAEVEALVSQQPADVQLKPDIYELAWQTVRARHQEEIVGETVKMQVADAVAAELKRLGIDPLKLPANGGRPPAHTSGEGRSVPQGSASGGRAKVRLPDAKTESALRAEATRRGLDFEDLLKTRGYMPR
jgi:hypothetical protein